MTIVAPSSSSLRSRLAQQPYLLLTLTSLFWAGNGVLGRFAAGQIPPVTLALLRWGVAFLLLLPFAWRPLAADWPILRARLGFMVLLSLIGISIFNTLQYTALQYTTALNVLLLQSAGPLFMAMWSLLLLRVRLTWAQAGGMIVSLIGVLVILLRGDLAALGTISLNRGDLIFLGAMFVFGVYPVLTLKRPAMHELSFLAFTFGCGAALLVPLAAAELMWRPAPAATMTNMMTVAYVAVFSSILAYLCYNRGVRLIGANRAAPFLHLVPAIGAALAIFLLGEHLELFHLVGFALVLAGVAVAARSRIET
ncbi:MAG: DMT family transporter [Xanthobacteraceae bacterium]|nr:DMT family transporter [Xanthobacteraceae bacterium]